MARTVGGLQENGDLSWPAQAIIDLTDICSHEGLGKWCADCAETGVEAMRKLVPHITAMIARAGLVGGDRSAGALEQVHKILFEDAALSDEHRMRRALQVITQAREAAVALPAAPKDADHPNARLVTGLWLAQEHRHACHDSSTDHECAQCRTFSAMLAEQQALLAEVDDLRAQMEQLRHG